MVKGSTRFDRLYTIGRSSKPLAAEALRLAIQEAKTGNSIQRYVVAQQLYASVAPDEPDSKLDQGWVDQTRKRNDAKTIQLEAELKGYKNNLVKESIRVSPTDGKYLVQTANLIRWATRI